MRAKFFIIALFLSCGSLWAQDSTVITIKSGNRIMDVLTTADIFHYPQFQNGLVFFRDGTKAKALMNYNNLFDQILFIDPNGDTLAIKDEKTIKLIAFSKDTFYYEEKFLRRVGGTNTVKLAEQRKWEWADIRKIGSHNRPAKTFAVTSYRTLTDGFGRTYDLALDEDVLLKKPTYYYFGDTYNHFVPANKKNIFLFFPNGQEKIAAYLRQHDVDFSKKDDLEKLIEFLVQK